MIDGDRLQGKLYLKQSHSFLSVIFGAICLIKLVFSRLLDQLLRVAATEWGPEGRESPSLSN